MLRITLRNGEVIDGECRGSGRNWIKVNEAGITIRVERAAISSITYASGIVERS